jgi:TatA/E family protein of Tat protein translocase
MFGIGGWEMLLIAVVALLVFGPKRLPELARQMGKGLSEFRRASSDLRRSFDMDLDPTRTPAPPPDTQPPAQAGDVATLPDPDADAAASKPSSEVKPDAPDADPAAASVDEKLELPASKTPAESETRGG